MSTENAPHAAKAKPGPDHTGSWKPWFAWRPVRLIGGSWTWLQTVERQVLANGWVSYRKGVEARAQTDDELNALASKVLGLPIKVSFEGHGPNSMAASVDASRKAWQALASAEGDGTKSLGEKLFDSLVVARAETTTWAALSDHDRTICEKAALDFCARLSHDEASAAAIQAARTEAHPTPPAERDFVRQVARLDHTGDEGWTPPEDDLDASNVMDFLIAKAREILAASSTPVEADADEVDRFLGEVRAELIRARAKFPGDRIMTIALAEEFGELCKAILDEPAANVRKEAVQTAVMAARVVLDGDGSVNDWRSTKGLDPLVATFQEGGL